MLAVVLYLTGFALTTTTTVLALQLPTHGYPIRNDPTSLYVALGVLGAVLTLSGAGVYLTGH